MRKEKEEEARVKTECFADMVAQMVWMANQATAPLMMAAVLETLKAGGDPNSTVSDGALMGFTSLALSAGLDETRFGDRHGLTQELLRAGADPDTPRPDGDSVVEWLCERVALMDTVSEADVHMRELEALIKAGARFKAEPERPSALAHALISDREATSPSPNTERLARFLLRHGLDPCEKVAGQSLDEIALIDGQAGAAGVLRSARELSELDQSGPGVSRKRPGL